MRAHEIRELRTQDQQQKMNDLKEELFNLRFQLASDQLENCKKIKETKKDIARVQTVMREIKVD